MKEEEFLRDVEMTLGLNLTYEEERTLLEIIDFYR